VGEHAVCTPCSDEQQAGLAVTISKRKDGSGVIHFSGLHGESEQHGAP